MTNKRKPSLRFSILIAIFTCIFCPAPSAKAQKASGLDKERGHEMASTVKNDLKKYYYDTSFHGMDVDARFRAADEKINSATSIGQIFGIIAQAMLDLEDSHTFFVPPSRSARTEYGFEMQMIGDQCFVSAVKPGSDAEVKGLKQGDEVLTINDFGTNARNVLEDPLLLQCPATSTWLAAGR